MVAAVPRHVDKPDEGPVRGARSDPAEAVGPDLVPPSHRRAAVVGLDESTISPSVAGPRHSKEIASGIVEASPMTGATTRGLDNERPGPAEVDQSGEASETRWR